MRPRHLLLAAATLAVALTAGVHLLGRATPPAHSPQPPLPSAPATSPGRVDGFAPGPGPVGYTVQPQPPPGSCHYRHTTGGQPLPDPRCTPGATNPRVTSSTLHATICHSGYTRSIRPGVAITTAEKRANAASYVYTGSLRVAEYDHLVPLELGGDPNDPRNLWVEPASPGHSARAGVNNPKDAVEDRLNALVCQGRVAFVAAQRAIAVDWTSALDVVLH